MKKEFTFIEPEVYLVEEAYAEYKNEYYNGRVIAMSGASIDHNIIVRNLIVEIAGKLKGKTCNVFPSDLKIVNSTKNSYLYPDVSIICGKVETLDENETVVTNPTVVIEVLSESTERYDRGAKFHIYTDIPTLKEYILVSSFECSIDVYRKIGADWFVYMYNSLDKSLEILSIGESVRISEIYEGVSVQ